MAQPLWPHLGQILALISLGQQPRECAMSNCLFVLACLPPSWATTCCFLTLSDLSSRSLMSLASPGIEALSGLSNTDAPLRPALALNDRIHVRSVCSVYSQMRAMHTPAPCMHSSGIPSPSRPWPTRASFSPTTTSTGTARQPAARFLPDGCRSTTARCFRETRQTTLTCGGISSRKSLQPPTVRARPPPTRATDC
jgi:hypothetical protein